MPKPGQLIRYYWDNRPSSGHTGDVNGCGWRLFLVLTVGHKFVTMLEPAKLKRVRVHVSNFGPYTVQDIPSDYAKRLKARAAERKSWTREAIEFARDTNLVPQSAGAFSKPAYSKALELLGA